MIRMEAVEKVYRTDRIETIALSDISLEIVRGEFVSIMGPSGCGKSTLLNIMGLLDRPSKGRVHLNGEDVSSRGDRSLATARNRSIGFIFQSFHLIPDLSVIDNVEMPLLYRPVSASERRRRASAALDRVGLSARKSHFPSQLSGGQQQRVAVARALVGEPDLLLADEPTGNLDSHTGDDVMSPLTSLCKDDGSTVVMVTHDAGMAERTQRTIRLFDGRQVH
jgi:putative ABC transport system ATP-binding protein